MIQAITYRTYWLTFVKTGRRIQVHQSCICSKTMQQILLKLGQLVMVFMESIVLSPSIKYSVYHSEHTAQCNQPPATRRLQSMLKEHYRLVHPDAKALKPVIIKRKRHLEGENSVLS